MSAPRPQPQPGGEAPRDAQPSRPAAPQPAASEPAASEPAADPTAALARAVTAQCIELLRDTYFPRLRRALAELPPGDLWWRPHERSTSVGNLLLHLRGNLQQWIVSGLGRAPDDRERDAEFSARCAAPGAASLLSGLGVTLHAGCALIERLDSAALLAPVSIQGFDTNGLGAVLHVTEHMSWHTGQIVWIAKLRAGKQHSLAFYDDAALAARSGTVRKDGRVQP